MTTQHTPGPWTARNISGAGWGVWADLRPALGEKFSKDFPLNGSDALKEQQIQISYETWIQFPSEAFNAMQGANTQLMAAAPDLLEACQTMIEWDDAEKNAEAWDKDQGKAWRERLALCSAAFEKARAAIAKATVQP